MKNSKTYLVLLLCLVFLISPKFSFGQWINTSGPEAGGFIGLVETDDFIVAVNDYGQHFRSYDKGLTWEYWQNHSFSSYRTENSLTFHDGILYVSYLGDGVHRIPTGDSGLSGRYSDGIEFKPVRSIKVIHGNLYIGLQEGGAYFRIAGAAKWENISAGAEDRMFYDFDYFKGDLYASTDQGIYRRDNTSQDESWEKLSDSKTATAENASLVVNQNLIYASIHGGCLTSEDGTTWIEYNLEIDHPGKLASFGDSTVLSGGQGAFYYKKAQNHQWEKVQILENQAIVHDVILTRDYGLCATENGMYRSTDKKSWEKINSGLTSTTVEHFMQSDGFLYCATRSHGLHRLDLNGNWQSINCGLRIPYDVVGNIVRLKEDLYVGLDGTIYHSINKGEKWDILFSHSNLLFGQILASDNGIMLTSASRDIYISYDSAKTWNVLPGINVELHGGYSSLILHGDTIFASPFRGGIYVTENLGVSWKKLDTPDEDDFINDVAYQNNRLVVSTTHNIYFTEDLGKTWQRKHYEYIPGEFLVSGDTIILKTGGPAVSTFQHEEWFTYINGRSPGNIEALIIANNMMYSGPYGNGVWKRPLAEFILPEIPLSSEKQSSELLVYPTITTGELQLSSPHSINSFRIIDYSGKEWHCPSNDDSGSKMIDTKALASGLYILLMETDNGLQMKKFIKN